MFFFSCGCSNLFESSSGILSFRKAEESDLTIVSWNLQTFFDAASSGNEYEDFLGKKSKWTEEKYRERVEKLCSYMTSMKADIFCFMEVENMAVIQDIANTLQTGISGMSWPYALFSKEEGASLGCAVFSRYEPESFFAHDLSCKAAVPTEAFSSFAAGDPLSQPALRPLMEIRFSFSSSDLQGEKKVALFVVHWKSKSGGAKESEVWRNCQEALLAGRIEKALSDGYSAVACGDFNKDLAEFRYSRNPGSIDFKGSFHHVTVSSPWFDSSDSGSYFYQDEWSRIDHFFFAGDVSCSSFHVLCEGDYVTSGGIPYAYDVWTGRGVSDHLPVFCQLCLE
ncbi:MAG: endonuclease/exonuclease/phosphatase family protein [Treponemataceae bacterium]|nr:endonuclease/exonuclease/phosphatase family protein [Treponemataceae bacterium]